MHSSESFEDLFGGEVGALFSDDLQKDAERRRVVFEQEARFLGDCAACGPAIDADLGAVEQLCKSESGVPSGIRDSTPERKSRSILGDFSRKMDFITVSFGEYFDLDVGFAAWCGGFDLVDDLLDVVAGWIDRDGGLSTDFRVGTEMDRQGVVIE